MSTTAVLLVAALIVVGVAGYLFMRKRQRPLPEQLMPGSPFPVFEALTEDGAAISSDTLRGAAAVILFVRGNWCPFCSAQVKNLTDHYKSIGDLGARLILITPKPLETTRRVAEFFTVNFEFWLDEDLKIARELGLLSREAVPKGHRAEYGDDSIWPTAVVVDQNGIIRFTALSKFIADRPNPEKLLQQLRSAQQH